MKKECPEDIKEWFLSEVAALWPVAGGSLSLRKNKCIRPHCSACLTGEGHPSYALHTRLKERQSSLYVPDELAEEVARAMQNGRRLKELLVIVGRRYVKALKAQRKEK